MNPKDLNNAFSKLKGMSVGSFVLLGLGWLATQSIYYGSSGLMQLTSATTPSSSIN